MQSQEGSRAGGDQQPLIRRETDYWLIVYEGALVRLRDAKGLRYLEHLLRHPGQSFHVAELMLLAPGHASQGRGQLAPSVVDERARKAVTNRIQHALARIRSANEPLGLHLSNSVRTGVRCSYRPERPIRWEA